MMKLFNPLMVKVFFVATALYVASGAISSAMALAIGIGFGLLFGPVFGKHNASLGKQVLQYSVVGLGFGVQITQVIQASVDGFWLTLVSILLTLAVGLGLGRLFKIEYNTATLVTSGTAICGGSAIAAVGSAIRANPQSMLAALCCVFVLNALALFIFPTIGHWLELSQQQFGLWAAVAIHDTSSVVGAAAMYGDQALAVATPVKLARALWIIPLAVLFAVTSKTDSASINFPWFILGFVGAAVLVSFVPTGIPVYDFIYSTAKSGLGLSLFLMGSSLTIQMLKGIGYAPMLQAVILWLLISGFSLLAIQQQILI